MAIKEPVNLPIVHIYVIYLTSTMSRLYPKHYPSFHIFVHLACHNFSFSLFCSCLSLSVCQSLSMFRLLSISVLCSPVLYSTVLDCMVHYSPLLYSTLFSSHLLSSPPLLYSTLNNFYHFLSLNSLSSQLFCLFSSLPLSTLLISLPSSSPLLHFH